MVIRRMTSTLLTVEVSALALTLLLSGCDEQPIAEKEPIRPVKAMKVGDIASGLACKDFPGKAQATQEVDLAFDVAGTLAKRPVNIGDTLKVGHLIASLDQRKFLAELKSAKAQLARAKADFARAEEMVKKDFISKTEYDELEAELAVSEANLDLAQKALTDSVIEAPFDGVIANLFVENYTAVQANQPVARCNVAPSAGAYSADISQGPSGPI